MDLFLTFFGGNPVPLQVDKCTSFCRCCRCAGSRPLPVQRPLACRRRRAALVPGPSASALACRCRHHTALVPSPSASTLACRRRRRAALVPGPSASALAFRRRRWPVGVRPRLPLLSSRRLSSLARRRPPLPAVSALTCRSRRASSRPLPDSVRPRLPSSASSLPSSRRRASFRCFVCVVISRN
jgi:hypothetical protein